LMISFYFFSPCHPGSSSSSSPFQFLSEDLFGHPILLHSLQVTQPTYPLPLYPFYYIFSFTLLVRDSSYFSIPHLHIQDHILGKTSIKTKLHFNHRTVLRALQYRLKCFKVKQDLSFTL
jgi:hypothetical protein